MSANDDGTLKTPIWSSTASELLDGKDWVDGLEFFRTVAKSIPPGVALRKAELIRSSSQRRRTSNDKGRKIERSQNMLVAAGRRAITQALVSTRRRKGIWEVDPFPLPDDAWYKGGWRIRNMRAPYVPVSVACKELSTTTGVLRALAAIDPPIEFLYTGPRKSLVHRRDMPELERRLQKKWADRATAKLRVGMTQPKTQPWYTMSDIEKSYGLSVVTLHKFFADHPQLRVIRQGRIIRIVNEDMEEFEKLLLVWVTEEHSRRVQGNRRDATRKSTGTQAAPSFQDPQLAASAAAFINGDAGPDQMHEDMRRVFQDLDEQDAAAIETDDSDEDEEWDDAQLATLVDDEE